MVTDKLRSYSAAKSEVAPNLSIANTTHFDPEVLS